MARFRIDYFDPETEETRRHYATFEDTEQRLTDENGIPFGDSFRITARAWAEDLAYTLADKHWYKVTEVNEQKENN